MRCYAKFNDDVVRRYEEWLVIQRYQPRTQQLYKRVVLRYLEFLREQSVAEATHLDIRSYLALLAKEGPSVNATYAHLCVLRRFYDFLHLGGLVDYVAPRFVRVRTPMRDHPRCLSEFVVRRYLRAARSSREKALVEFLYGTGCHTCEIRSLRIENVDFDARLARVSGKGRVGRPVLITKRAIRALQDYVGLRKSGFVYSLRFLIFKFSSDPNRIENPQPSS